MRKVQHLPGQSGRLHTSVLVADPEHSLPPLAGAGLLHFLVLMISPSPQVTEHAPPSKADQLPSTKKNWFDEIRVPSNSK